jgi:RNA polymerase sigma-70 factor (ECF subfamily)
MPELPEEMLPSIYQELRSIAARYMGRERPGHTLQPTALVNEVYLKLFAKGTPSFTDRAHFLAAASQAMRRILVSHARSRNSEKRRRDVYSITLSSDDISAPSFDPVDLFELDDAIEALAAENPRLAEAVDMHYFAGMTAEEAAEATGRSVHTIRHDLRFAHAWLRRRLAGEAPS